VKRFLPTREQILRSRWLGPVAHHLRDEHLWHMDRSSVARGVAIGLFFGLLLPVLQFLFAVVTAVFLRANVAIAAAATLVSNPLTFPPLYWMAYRIGRALLGEPPDEHGAAAIEAHAEAAVAERSWLAAAWQTIQDAGAPLVVGLATMAVVAAAVGFAAVWLLWRPRRH
jgi:uncharacterized protein (DUF2062 family)